MLYSNQQEVLLTAGLENNSNISPALVNTKIVYADSIIDGIVSSVYAFPLPIFYENTIEFKGRSTGTSDLVISIGGIDYTLTLTIGQTALSVADVFRNLVLENTSDKFEVNAIDNVAFVRIISLTTNDKSVVSITSTNPQTVDGITVLSKTPKPRAHQIIREISQELAASQLLQIAYGNEAENTDKDGNNRMQLAMEGLLKIKEKEIRLIDGIGSEFPTSQDGRISFFPNDTSSTGDGDSSDTSARFNVNQVF